MSAPSPDCLVQDGSGSFVPTPGGVDVTPGNTITVKLASSAGVQSWQLAIVGYDGLTATAIPAVTSVVGPPQSFTFPYPNATGRAVRVQSTVTDNQIPANTYVSTFALYTLIAGARVIAFGETTEGNSLVGYVESINVAIRGGGGGGGGSGAVYNALVTSTPGSPLTRAAWQVQPVGTASAAVTITFPAGAQENDRIDCPDADRSFGTHALTVDGNGHNVEDPENAQATPAGTYTTPANFSTQWPAWVLLRNSSSVLTWKAVQG